MLLQVTFLSCMYGYVECHPITLHSPNLKLNACSIPQNKPIKIVGLPYINFTYASIAYLTSYMLSPRNRQNLAQRDRITKYASTQ